jgi:hypothetical protein
VSSLDGEALAGSPFKLEVAAGGLSPAHCTATLAAGALQAGAAALVHVDARDEHGNQVLTPAHSMRGCIGQKVCSHAAGHGRCADRKVAPSAKRDLAQAGALEGGEVSVHAQGPAAVSFLPAAGGAPGSFAAAPTVAGTYVVHAQVRGHALPDWPKVLHVGAGPSDASRCGTCSPANTPLFALSFRSPSPVPFVCCFARCLDPHHSTTSTSAARSFAKPQPLRLRAVHGFWGAGVTRQGLRLCILHAQVHAERGLPSRAGRAGGAALAPVAAHRGRAWQRARRRRRGCRT